jgi:hypothetical protein
VTVSDQAIHEAEKRLWRSQFSGVRRILMEHWDPMGVNGIPEAEDEYDPYAGAVLSALRCGSSTSDIERHLRWIVAEHMGLDHAGRDYSDLMRRLLDLRNGA